MKAKLWRQRLLDREVDSAGPHEYKQWFMVLKYTSSKVSSMRIGKVVA